MCVIVSSEAAAASVVLMVVVVVSYDDDGGFYFFDDPVARDEQQLRWMCHYVEKIHTFNLLKLKCFVVERFGNNCFDLMAY